MSDSEGQTNQTATVLGHKVNGFRGYELGGKNQVALVLAVFLVNEDDHAAGTQIGNDLCGSGYGHEDDSRKARHFIGFQPRAVTNLAGFAQSTAKNSGCF